MDLIKKEIVLQSYEAISDLDAADQMLLQEAKEALKTAYAPYSKFYVGCALLLANGKIVRGSNQENIAFPSGLCAERVAVFHAGSEYPDVLITGMAITVKAADYLVAQPAMSCGACLQSLSEYEMKQRQPIRTILQGETGAIFISEQGTRSFLPFQFEMEQLKR